MPTSLSFDYVSSKAYLIQCPHCNAVTFLEAEEKKWDKSFTATILSPVENPGPKYVDRYKVLGNWVMAVTKQCWHCRRTFCVKVAHVDDTGYTMAISKNPLPWPTASRTKQKAKAKPVVVFYDSDSSTYLVKQGGVLYKLMPNGKLEVESKKPQ